MIMCVSHPYLKGAHTHTHTLMYRLLLVLTNLGAMLSVKVELEFQLEEQCTEEEYHEGMYELILEAIHQYHGADYMNEFKKVRLTFREAMTIVKSLGYRYHEFEM
jgi:hypothetical protein